VVGSYAERGAAGGRLHDDREVESLLDRRERVRRAQLLEGRLAEGEELGSRYPRLDEQVLGQDLVDRAHAGEDARPGVGDAEDLEELLHSAVFTVAAVQCHERGIRRGGAQALDQVGAGIDGDDVVPQALERVLNPGARAQRHLPLQ